MAAGCFRFPFKLFTAVENKEHTEDKENKENLDQKDHKEHKEQKEHKEHRGTGKIRSIRRRLVEDTRVIA